MRISTSNRYKDASDGNWRTDATSDGRLAVGRYLFINDALYITGLPVSCLASSAKLSASRCQKIDAKGLLLRLMVGAYGMYIQIAVAARSCTLI